MMMIPPVLHCAYCGLTYCNDVSEDLARDLAEHRRTTQIKVAHPGYEPDYERREVLKWAAPPDTVEHLENLVRAHWSRSLQSWGSRWRQHPRLDEYRRAWLAEEHTRMGSAGLSEMIEKYGAVPSSHLADGSSYWRADPRPSAEP
jgi:hypothetical protein